MSSLGSYGIVDAIERRDAAAAEQAARNHIREAYKVRLGELFEREV
ncbi:FCD domain-containing protein [Zobellella denitrificans]|nr:FCD domain-containing protein [Zobellella denitrificans]